MKKAYINICKWAAGLLLVSIAGGCSASRKAAKTPEETAVEETAVEGKDEVKDTVPARPVEFEPSKQEEGRIRLMYGVRPVDYKKVDE